MAADAIAHESAVFGKRSQGRVFIVAHEARVTHDVRGDDGDKLAFGVLQFHGPKGDPGRRAPDTPAMLEQYSKGLNRAVQSFEHKIALLLKKLERTGR